MITDAGKKIVMANLSGLTNSCFDYLAVGTGAPVNASSQTFSYPQMNEMQFEVDRFPVTSIVPVDNDTVQITTEIPQGLDARISEIGLFSHLENTFGGSPSRIISGFGPNEIWYAGTSIETATAIQQLTSEYPAAATSLTTGRVSNSQILAGDNIYWNETVRAGSSGLYIIVDSAKDVFVYRNMPKMNLVAEPGDIMRLACVIGNDLTGIQVSATMTIGSHSVTTTTRVDTTTTVTYNGALNERKYSVPYAIAEYSKLYATGFDQCWQAVNTYYNAGVTHFDVTYPSLADGQSVEINTSDSVVGSSHTVYPTKYLLLDFPIQSQIDFNNEQQISIQFHTFAADRRLILDGLRYINKRNVNPYYGMTVYNVARNANSAPIVLSEEGTSIIGLEVSL